MGWSRRWAGVVIRLRGMARWTAAGIILLALSWLLAEGIVEPVVQTAAAVLAARRVPVYKVDTPEKKIALSFDATWGTENTEALLDLMDRFGVKTTFFLAGNWLEANPDWVKEIARRGHEIGSHSYAHAHMNRLSRAEIRADLARAHALIKELTGTDPWLFRPPFGEYGNALIEEAEQMGYVVVQWSIDSLDWKDVSASFMVERVLSRAGPGDIVLFHNAGKHTPEAVETILTRLQADGYRIVPVGELVYRDHYEIDPYSGLQRRKPPAPPAPPPGSPGTGESRRTVTVGQEQRAAPIPVPDGAVFYVPTQERLWALAVNVDWGEEHLEALLATLARFDVRATFFPTGRWAQRNPHWVERFVAEGHEVGNHGMNHHHPKQLSDAALKALIDDGARLLARLTGGRAVNLFAPPYGEFDERIVAVARQSGHATVLWTIDTVDWRRPPAAVIVERVVSRMRPGAIVLAHPVAATVEALPVVFQRLADAGYRAVPVGELLRAVAVPE